ncbi:MAG: SigE family RNA polymerase sigma factor [Jatrophihabitans sp.]|uniref:SigE family RNA polymerase sigma factor n=1 Tax=Jatrophihabitans sp. TaxID=1932789 RepID=UPI003F7D5022
MTAPDRFSAFVGSSSRTLHRAAWLLTGDWAAAEDLLQTAYAATWTHWATAQHAPEAYTRVVLTRTFLAWRKRRWTGEIPSDELPDTVGTGRDAMDDAARRRDLQACLDLLPRQQRAAVVLRYFADLSEAQTAEAMGCSVGAVKTHTSRALARLRQEPAVAAVLTGGMS